MASIDYDPAAVPLTEEFATHTMAERDNQTFLVGRLPGRGDGNASGSGKSLLLFAHPDTEPFQPDPRWTSDPKTLSVRRGRAFGWGVADALAGLVMMVGAVSALQSAGVTLASDLTIVSAPSKRHRRGIAAAMASGISADAAVYCHPAESGRGLDEVTAFAPGQLEFSITVQGAQPQTYEPAHTAFAHRGTNALQRARPILDALHALGRSRAERLSHPRLEHAIGRSVNLMVSRCVFGLDTPLSRLPAELELGGAMTLIPGESMEAVKAEVEAAIGAASSAGWLAKHPPALTWLSGVSAAETPDDAPIFQRTAAVLRAVGAEPAVNPLHTSSDIRNPIVQQGIPTVGFGPLCGGLTMAGDANEWVDVAELSRATLALANLVADWCGIAEP